MTNTQTGRGDAAAIISLPSTPQGPSSTHFPSQCISQHMATVNVEQVFAEAQNHQTYDDNFALMNIPRSLDVPYPQHDNDDGMYMANNYELFQPSVLSYMDLTRADCSQFNPVYSQSPYTTEIDPPRQKGFFTTRSVSPVDGSTGSMEDRSYSPFNSTIAPHQVYQYMPPSSDPHVYIPEDNYDPNSQRQDGLDYFEENGLGQQTSNYMYGQQNNQNADSFEDAMSAVDGDDGDVDKAEPYAKLLFRCLLHAPGYTMILRDIYDWFKLNTDKGRDPKQVGWMNSIRHNLSMNKAFEKIEASSTDDPNKKAGYQWRLSEQAIREGRVESTTRFRKRNDSSKRNTKSQPPAPHRQASGARGGAMSAYTSSVRRSKRLRENHRDNEKHTNSLRARGILPMHGPNSAPPRSSGFAYPDEILSRPTSPYFLQENTPLYSLPSQKYDEQAFSFTQHSPAMQQYDSHPSSPELVGVPDVHFGPIGERIFYDSPESGSEPMTPASEQYTEIYGSDPSPWSEKMLQ